LYIRQDDDIMRYQKSEELGIVAYLEAIPMGKPLYALMGYRPVRETVFDATKYGAKI